LRLTEVTFPAQTRIAYESHGGGARVQQQVWVINGNIDITTDGVTHRLRVGDCLAMSIELPTVFDNPNPHKARYLVAQAQA
jgi:uncharacterized cupin superfamily protein